MKVPFLSFDHTNNLIREELKSRFEEFFESKWYVLGEQLRSFESEYATFNKCGHAIGVGSGLDALILSLHALGVGHGDEVIVPSNTYIASVLAVSHVGATPILVEPDIRTYNLDPRKIEQAITAKTKGILPVHLYGQPCEMDQIMEIAQRNHWFVVEDNAQAHGATGQGQLTGTFGDINATSFYPTKNLGAFGEAGAVTTDSLELAEKVRSLRNYGSSNKYYNDYKGVNSRMDELQAGLLRVKLKYLLQWNKERQAIASRYLEQLSEISGDLLTLPYIHPQAQSVFHLFVVRTPKRDELQDHLAENEIGTQIHYPVPPHLQKAYSDLGHKKGDFPIAEEIADTALSLPLFVGMTHDQIDYVCEKVRAFFS